MADNIIITQSHQLLDVARSLITIENPLIIEAGAFWGHDSLKMVSAWPKSTIHAFEPVPAVFNELNKRTEGVSNIITHNKALSSVDGFVDLYVAYKKDRISQASSIHQPYKRLDLSPITFPEKITVPSVTLGSFMAIHNISTIDMLWLDLQGHEMDVLQSSVHLLNQINMIHMEVYFEQAYKDHLLYEDILLWLYKHNFRVVAQDFKTTKGYFFGNILCIPSDSRECFINNILIWQDK